MEWLDFKEFLKALGNTQYMLNPFASREEEHPEFTVEVYAPPDDESHAVRIFFEAIANLFEADYGDFMRKANIYLVQLKTDLARSKHPDIPEKLEQMQWYTQFEASWEVEPTRNLLLADSRLLLEMLKETTTETKQGSREEPRAAA